MLAFLLLRVLLLSLIVTAGPIKHQPASTGDDSNRYVLGTSRRNATFDYVVIGGGTAGLVLATRLAQDPNTTVAVIEAGGFYEVDNGNLSVIPSDDVYFCGASPTDVNPLVDWGFVTSSQAGLDNRKLHYARGKTLGGSSGRNYFTYQRGTIGSYSKWAAEVGDSTYEFDAFLPFFKKSVEFTPPNSILRAQNASLSYNMDAFSSEGSPLQVSVPIWANPFSSFAKIAFNKLGLDTALDFVSGTLFGVQYNMNTIDPKGQIRSSSESSFLRSASNAPNLHVYNNTLAKEVMFNGKKAFGVLVQAANTQFSIFSRNEIILSAGAFQSPQLLMVSGVGPADTLRQFDIPIVSALPGVGQNMWDNFLFGQSYQVTPITHSALGNTSILASETEKYLTNGTGLLGNPGGDLIGWEKLPRPQRDSLSNMTQAALATFPSDWPEIEYLILDAYSGDNQNYITGAPRTPFMYASPAAALVAPLSRGNVSISSADTADPPIINPNWLTHPADQELAIAAFRRVRQLMDTDVMKSVTVGSEVFPGRNVSSDAQILNAIKDNGIMVFHASATCKMGTSQDPMAVVDSHARVFGTEALRVVDASTFPFLPPGHPQSTVYALAEKIADEIIKGRV